MKISFVILHFGDIKTTQLCVQSLYRVETQPFSLIVVNNTEKKYTPKDFTTTHSARSGQRKITVINNKKNLGFAAGVNIGIRYALQKKADAICLLNNDTAITKPILATLSSHFQEKHVGIVGPAIQFKKDNRTLYDIGGKINKFFLKTSHEEVLKIQSQTSSVVDYVSGCCMLIHKEVFKKIGLFDTSFFLYYEDADFCLRAQKKAFNALLDSTVVIHHELSKSAGKASSFTVYHLLKSNITFGKKYAKSTLQKIANRLFILFQSIAFLKANLRSALVITRAMLE